MQDIDRPAHIQPLPQPGGACRPCMEAESLHLVPRPECLHRISGHRDGRRHLGEEPAVWPPELERAIGHSLDLVTLLVHRAMMPPTEQREVRQRREAAVGPVPHMMSLAQR